MKMKMFLLKSRAFAQNYEHNHGNDEMGKGKELKREHNTIQKLKSKKKTKEHRYQVQVAHGSKKREGKLERRRWDKYELIWFKPGWMLTIELRWKLIKEDSVTFLVWVSLQGIIILALLKLKEWPLSKEWTNIALFKLLLRRSYLCSLILSAKERPVSPM